MGVKTPLSANVDSDTLLYIDSEVKKGTARSRGEFVEKAAAVYREQNQKKIDRTVKRSA